MAHNSVLERIYKEKEPKIMGGCSRVLRASLGAFLLVGFLWFSFVCISANGVTTITVPSSGNLKLLKFIETERKRAVHRNYGLNYVSKRRVPNGPDPIHNRLARKYRRPPGRV